MIDYAKYIGIPFNRGGRSEDKSLDCWGLVTYFYKNELGINLPTFSHITTSNGNYANASDQLVNTDLYKQFQVVENAQQHDLLLFRVGNHPLHIAVAIDHMRMLHTHDLSGSVIERFDIPKWQSKLHSIHRLT